jgi:predicted SprT family Zn-dependent metalloprotease
MTTVDDYVITERTTLKGITWYAREILKREGLADAGWVVVWDHAKRRFGQCCYSSKQIHLSQAIFSQPENRPKAQDTILHEVAHALAGPGAGHGPLWVSQALALGAVPQRTASVVVAPKGAWLGSCGCGQDIHTKYRMTKGRTWSCRKCQTTVTWKKG